jgi:hypothetical protein
MQQPTVENLVDALEGGVIRRRWVCYSDKGADCTPEDKGTLGYLHAACRWHWDLYTVDQKRIETLYATRSMAASEKNA